MACHEEIAPCHEVKCAGENAISLKAGLLLHCHQPKDHVGEQSCLEGSYIIPWRFKYVYTGRDSRLEDRHPPLP